MNPRVDEAVATGKKTAEKFAKDVGRSRDGILGTKPERCGPTSHCQLRGTKTRLGAESRAEESGMMVSSHEAQRS